MDRGAWKATVHGVLRVRPNLVTKPPQPLLNNIPLIPPPQAPGNHHSALCFYEFCLFTFHRKVVSYNICLSMLDSPHFDIMPSRHIYVGRNDRSSFFSHD